MQDNYLERAFPGLNQDSYRIASPPEPEYNCFAWAAGEAERWWEPGLNEPGVYWPDSVPDSNTLDSYIQAFESLGYETCDTDELESGFEKVALFVDPQGDPTHAARQLASGAWTSKIGKFHDIVHDSLTSLQGTRYGAVAIILKRPHRATR